MKRIKSKYKNIEEVFTEKYLRNNRRLCFKHINLFLKHESIGLFTCFSNKQEHIEFRDYVFDYLQIKRKSKESNKNEIKICLIVRNENQKLNNRNILNLDKVYKLLKEISKTQISIISFEKMNPVEQISEIMRYNLIISPHGCSLFNMIWLINRKVVIIEIFNRYFIRQELLKESITYEYLYLPIYTTKQTLENELLFNKDSFYSERNNLICNGYICLDISFKRTNYDIYINLRVLLFNIELGINYLNHFI